MAKATLIVEIDLDAVPGAMFTKQSARDYVEFVLNSQLGHYNPEVKIQN